MNRYASHYLYIPGQGYLKRHVVEVEKGCVVRIFPLSTEMGGLSWFPGVIALWPDGENNAFVPYLYYPFDFTNMLPVAGTRRRQLP